jgi:cytochrome c-type biogenesis protein CcmH/NrfG
MKPLLMILLLGLILISVVAPFSGLALLMIVLLGSTFLWTIWTLVQTLITGKVNQTSDKG